MHLVVLVAAVVDQAQLGVQVLLAVQGHWDKVTLVVMLLVLHLTHQAAEVVRVLLAVVRQVALVDQAVLALHIQYPAHLLLTQAAAAVAAAVLPQDQVAQAVAEMAQVAG